MLLYSHISGVDLLNIDSFPQGGTLHASSRRFDWLSGSNTAYIALSQDGKIVAQPVPAASQL